MTTAMRRREIGELIRVERERLTRDLGGLSRDAWEAPSLCDGWRVRDVVGHLIRTDRAYRRGYPLLVDLARGGFRPNAALASAARRVADGRSPEDLVEALSKTRYERGVRVHPTPAVPLGELLIHGQDIRRAIGRRHDIPPGTFAVAARGSLSVSRYAFGWGRAPKGVRLQATDTEWTYGSGDEVRGSMEAILMTLARREATLDDLEGPGVPALRRA